MNNNKFFALIALSAVFLDIRGMNKLPDIGKFGYQKTEMNLFLEELKVDDAVPDMLPLAPVQAEVNIPQPMTVFQPVAAFQPIQITNTLPLVKPKRDYALNVLDMLDAEKARIISQAIGLKNVPGPKMINWLKFLGFSCSLGQLECSKKLVDYINNNWPLIERRIEKQQGVWMDISMVYKPMIQDKLAPLFGGRAPTESEVVKFYIGLVEFAKLQRPHVLKVGSARYVRRSHARVWQEMYCHWSVIEMLIPVFLESKKGDSGIEE